MNRYDDADLSTQGWSPLEYVQAFHANLRGIVINRFMSALVARPHITLDDLVAVAEDALLDLAGKFTPWCIQRDIIPRRNLFASMLTKAIVWDIINVLDRDKRRHLVALEDLTANDEQPEHDDLARTQLNASHPHSMLQSRLVQHLATLPHDRLVYLALRFYDELSLPEIEHLTGVGRTALGNRYGYLTSRVHTFAMSEILDDTDGLPTYRRSPDWGIPQPVVEYVRGTYGCDPEAYVARVLADWAVDVSYLVDMLDRSHGATRPVRRDTLGLKAA